jgi:rare lipoprotein A
VKNNKLLFIKKLSLATMFSLASVISIGVSGPPIAGTEVGKASYYADMHVGKKTASGEIYRHNNMTAAHKTLPFGQKVKVCLRKQPDRCVVVRINDRGPFATGRVIDLSKAAAKRLDLVRQGIAAVTVHQAGE